LAERINRFLDDRGTAFLKHWTAARLERDAQLLALCAEAAKAQGA